MSRQQIQASDITRMFFKDTALRLKYTLWAGACELIQLTNYGSAHEAASSRQPGWAPALARPEAGDSVAAAPVTGVSRALGPGGPSSPRAARPAPSRPSAAAPVRRPAGCRVPRSQDFLGARAGGRRNSAQSLQQLVAGKLSPGCRLEKLQNCCSPVRTCSLSSSLFLSIWKSQTARLRLICAYSSLPGGMNQQRVE
ncbi:uncharacterized protein LOC108306112 [Cebus imitator]|uniref:uncharacterized protein LOC108306112 n=1 Tax=Cebus imitator TaxID=2715852 RepID=UPI00080A0F62|nr:uncharacterized protein LOC108306112 [Cebus imitator]